MYYVKWAFIPKTMFPLTRLLEYFSRQQFLEIDWFSDLSSRKRIDRIHITGLIMQEVIFVRFSIKLQRNVVRLHRRTQTCFGVCSFDKMTPIVRRGGTKSHLKSQFPTEMTLLQSQQNFQSHLKSNFLFTPISNIYFTGVKVTICRVSLIGIYWYQSTNKFTNSHLFMHSHKGGLNIDLIKPPLRKCINKLENYI